MDDTERRPAESTVPWSMTRLQAQSTRWQSNGQACLIQCGRCLVLTSEPDAAAEDDYFVFFYSRRRLLLVVGRNTEIEFCVLEIVEKRIISIFGPCLQWQAKLLHERCSIKLNAHDHRQLSKPNFVRDIRTAKLTESWSEWTVEESCRAQGENLL